jgi:starvation-inducible DNA-binding protein
MNTESWNTQNDLPALTRSAVVALLNPVLADLVDLGLQAKHAHWNVKGPNFISLHELFDHVEDEVEEIADEVAERIVALGGVAHGTLQNVHRTSRLSAYSPDLLTGAAHVRALSAALTAAARFVRPMIDASAAAGDAATSDVFTQATRAIDKLLWKVEAHAFEGS